jgi:hypothetical protein
MARTSRAKDMISMTTYLGAAGGAAGFAGGAPGRPGAAGGGGAASMKTKVVAVQLAVMVEAMDGSLLASTLRLLTFTIRESRLRRSKKYARLW